LSAPELWDLRDKSDIFQDISPLASGDVNLTGGDHPERIQVHHRGSGRNRPATLQKYGAKVPETLAPFNGQYIIRGGKTTSLEGEPPKTFVVMIAFESMEKAQAWYDSPAYDAIKPIRQSATRSRLFIAEGVAPR
jgi:uncharacterized protein (DUF1330 family)